MSKSTKERARFRSSMTGIRPRPQDVTVKSFGRLCDGRCKGNVKCTFPHSKEEQAAWNATKRHSKRVSGSLTLSRSLAQCPPPQSQSHQQPVSSCQHPTSTMSTPRLYSDVVKIKSAEPVYSEEPQKTAKQKQLKPQKPEQPLALHSRESSESVEPQKSGKQPKTIEPLKPLKPEEPLRSVESLKPEEPLRSVESLKPKNKTVELLKLEERTEPLVSLTPAELSKPVIAQAQYDIHQGPIPSHQHSATPVMSHSLNIQKHIMKTHPSTEIVSLAKPCRNAGNSHLAPTSPRRKPSYTSSHYYHYHQPSRLVLTRKSYKVKFRSLLDCEKEEHGRILKEKCDCQCTLVLSQAGVKPDWLNPRKHRPTASYVEEHCFGYLDGLNSDQITYATQASQGAILHFDNGKKIEIDVVSENYEHTEQKLYIAIKNSYIDLDIMKEKISVGVEFTLKYSYFKSLHRAIQLLPEESIKSLLPERSDFTPVLIQSVSSETHTRLKLHSCSSDQMTALNSIISCPSNGPPVLVSGSFGTGKTRLLAIVSHYFLQRQQPAKQPVRILVCAQQHVSADAFLEYFTRELMIQDDKEVCIVRLAPTEGYRSRRLEDKEWYMDFDELDKVKHKIKILIVATCITAKNLANKFILPQGFFTHVLLDEGAQMREPEAVASLCLAGPNTKIIIAGDQNQVGPITLVLGEEARRYGLQRSLLGRLFDLYKSMGEVAKSYYSVLTTNFRCHPAILELASELFYGSSLVCRDNDSIIPQVPYPLMFICSSIDKSVCHIQSATNEVEARIVLQQVDQLVSNWPIDHWGYSKNLDDVAVVSPHRSQTTLIDMLLNSEEAHFPRKLKGVRKIPTFNIQGHEFRAVFISTSEPTEEDGSTSNPTKSISDRYVFNTTLTRARSLVVAVGNPFLLLKIEEHMAKKYGEEGRCWSKFLKVCLEHNSLSIGSLVNASQEEKEQCLLNLRRLTKASRKNFPSHIHLKENQQLTETCPIPHQPKSQPEDTTKISVLPTTSGIESRLMEIYDDVKFIGRGSFGMVFQVKHKTDEDYYAVKVVALTKGPRKSEVQALAKLTHPGIVRYYDSSIEKGLSCEPWTFATDFTNTKDQTSGLDHSDSGNTNELKVTFSQSHKSSQERANLSCNYLFIRTELCEKKTLKDWLRDHDMKRSRKKVLLYFQQILDAVGYIHKQGMAHCDLKPSNIFFSKKKTDQLKVGDFGLVTGSITTYSHSVYPSLESGSRTLKGTSFYMSPEQKRGKKCDAKTDVFALGVILFELHYPFKTEHEREMILETLMQRTFPETFKDLYESEANLIEKMLMENSLDRPTVAAASEELKVVMDNVMKADKSQEIGRIECPSKQTQIQGKEQMKLLPLTSSTMPNALHSLLESHAKFIDPVEIINCDSSGGIYHNPLHGVTLRIPEEAIPHGEHLEISIGVGLYGNLSFPEGVSPVSAIVWLCSKTVTPVPFLKPVEVIIPHFLDCKNKEEVECLEMQFLKGNHRNLASKSTHFDPADGEADFISVPNKGIFRTQHFCYLCISAKISPEQLKRHKFYIACAIRRPLTTGSVIYFYVLHFLNTCIEFLKKQLSEGYFIVEQKSVVFKFSDVGIITAQYDVQHSAQRPVTVTLENNHISQTSTDFWQLHRNDELELMVKMKLYPPSMQLTFGDLSSCEEQVIMVQFGGTQEPVNQMKFIVPERDDSNQTISDTPTVPVQSRVRTMPTLKDEVHMSQLLHLKTVPEETPVRIIERLAVQWKNLGLTIDFDRQGIHVQLIEQKFGYEGPVACCIEVLRDWLSGKGAYQPSTWENLLEILKYLDDNLATTLHNLLTTDDPESSKD